MIAVAALRDRFEVDPVLRVLGIPPSTFYGWLAQDRRPSARRRADADLLREIVEITIAPAAYAWVRYGGGDLLVAWGETMSQMIIGEIDRALTGEPDSVAAVRSGCAAAGRWAVDAAAYFTIPDPEQQGRWEQAQAIVSSASADCIAAGDRGDAEGLSTAFSRMAEALMLISGVTDRLPSWRQ